MAAPKTVVQLSQGRLRRTSNFASGFKGGRMAAVNQKYFSSGFRKIMLVDPIPSRQEGRYGQSSPNVGRDAMDAKHRRRTMRTRTTKLCGPVPPTLGSSLRMMILQATAASKHGRRGERSISRKPLRRERRIVSADL
jgi:hypothetical protein